MKDKIQKQINDSYVEAEKALALYRTMLDTNQFSRMDQFMNCYLAFSAHATKLDLLLNTENEEDR